MNGKSFRIAIVVTDFVCSPEEITSVLSISPTKTWVEGEKRVPQATITHKENGWCHELETDELEKFPTLVDKLINMLKEKKENFLKLPGGTYLELRCRLFLNEHAPEFHLDSKTIKILDEIGVELDLDIYIV